MRVLILGALLFANPTLTSAQDKYVLPKEIIEARDQLLASKRKLDLSIMKSYADLCQRSQLTEAQRWEYMAYQEITQVDCRGLFIQGI